MTSVETLIFNLIARDAQASAAFDRFRRSVDNTSGSLDKNTASLQKNSQAQASALGGAVGLGVAFSAMASPIVAAGSGIVAFAAVAAPSVLKVSKAITGPGGLNAAWATLDNRQKNMALGVQTLGKRYSELSAAMEPRTAQVFGTALGLVNTALGPFSQLAAASGKSLEGFLVQFSQQSGLNQFITFMSHEAGPAIALLGTDITNITHAVFKLLESWGGLGLTELKAVTAVITGITNSLSWLAEHAPGLTAAGIAIGGVALALSKFGLLAGALKLTGITTMVSEIGLAVAATKGLTLAERGLIVQTIALNAVTPWGWAILGAAALGGLIYATRNYRDGTQSLIDELAKQDKATGLNVAGYAKLAAALKDTSIAQLEQSGAVVTSEKDMAGFRRAQDELTAGQITASEKARNLHDDFASLGEQYGLNADQVKTLIVKSGALNDILAHNGRITPEAAQKIADWAAAEDKASGLTNTLAEKVTSLTDAMNKNVIAVLTLQGDEIAWRMALQAADKQLRSNSAGLKGNSANALANKQAVIAATNAAVSFADDQLKLHGNLKLASQEIQSQIDWLQKHGDKTKFARDQIHALRLEEAKIKGQIGTNITVHGSGKWSVIGTGPFAGKPTGTAAGGLITGGIRGMDSVPILAMPGEVVIPTDLVARGAVDHLRGQLPGFGAGGVVGSYGNGVTGLSGWLASENAATVKAVQQATASAIFAAIRSGPPGGGAGGAARWAPIILAALGLLGQSPSWLGLVERRMNQESGGNPYAVNKWDSNWLAGTPSVGLMQVIGPTFAAYAGPFRNIGPFAYGVSEAPLANTYAGLNYALHRYGSLSALGQPGGYDQGGWLMPGRLGLNTTSRPERVVSGAQEDAMTDRLDAILDALGELIGATHAAPSRTAAGVAGALGGAAHGAMYSAMYGAR